MRVNNTEIGYIINEGIDVESDAVIISGNGRRVIAEGRLQTAE